MRAPHSPSRKLALLVLTGAYVLSQFYRSYVAVIATQLIDDFRLSPQMFGLFAGALYFTFAIAQLPIGLAFDRFGVRRPVLFCLCVGSVGALLLPLTRSVPVAIIAHVCVGIGCAPLYMGLLNFVLKSGNGAEQVRTITRASALGYVGAIAAGLPLALGVELMGWRWSLAIVGLLMVLAAVGVALTLREDAGTPRNPGIDGAVAGQRSAMTSWVAFSGLVLASFALIAGGTFRMSWGGPYFADIFQFDVVQRGYAMTAASVLAIGWALSIPRVLRFMDTRTLVRCAFAVGVVSALILAQWPARSPWLGVALVCVLFCVGSIHPLVMSQARSVVPQRRLGLWLGVLNSMVFLGVAVSNSAFGWIAEHSERHGILGGPMYSRLFFFTATVMLIGWLGATLSPRVAGGGR
ncbi:MFS transporter [Diaphorobacter aerolatus]|uniref:MFS transporter n=1 Tax=Diaphorobacter aerolatus TaxID=1288495 RepID=A0A7H0GKU9_9BURK|nr:MFS transporter [Diaphorobacter aerolatus]QNP48915.1 MFS transporter [Diaphorobacter aerolatus]